MFSSQSFDQFRSLAGVICAITIRDNVNIRIYRRERAPHGVALAAPSLFDDVRTCRFRRPPRVIGRSIVYDIETGGGKCRLEFANNLRNCCLLIETGEDYGDAIPVLKFNILIISCTVYRS